MRPNLWRGRKILGCIRKYADSESYFKTKELVCVCFHERNAKAF